MEVHVNPTGGAINLPGDDPTPNFTKSKTIMPCVLGAIILERKIPSKYAFLVGDSFVRNPEPFEKVYAEKYAAMLAQVGTISGTPNEQMINHQILCQSIEWGLFSIACEIVKREERNYLALVIEGKLHEPIIAKVYADGEIDETEAAEITTLIPAIGDGFNVYCSTAFEDPTAEFNDATFGTVIERAIKDLINQRKQQKMMAKQQEVFAAMMGDLTADGHPIDQNEFNKKLKEAGFVPVNSEGNEIEIADAMTDVVDLPEIEGGLDEESAIKIQAASVSGGPKTADDSESDIKEALDRTMSAAAEMAEVRNSVIDEPEIGKIADEEQ